MEFTVSKADLVRELSLSQGVVEKKTTIPILSNILLDAQGRFGIAHNTPRMAWALRTESVESSGIQRS